MKNVSIRKCLTPFTMFITRFILVFGQFGVFINFFVLVTANTYDYIVDQQPIGRELFRLYCCRKPQLARAIQFLDRVVKISLV